MDRFGLVNIATITPNNIKIGNPKENAKEIIRLIRETKCNSTEPVEIMAFPELALTGYTCGDLFFQDNVIREAQKQLIDIAKQVNKELVFIGLPVKFKNKLYDCCAALNNGKILAIIPKINICNNGEFCESKYFLSGNNLNDTILIGDKYVKFTTNILFRTCYADNELIVGCEINHDAFSPIPVGANHCVNGANLIVNIAANNEVVGKSKNIKNKFIALSESNICAYAYTSAQKDESTSDTVYSGQKLIIENGEIVNETNFPNNEEIVVGCIDIEKINKNRTKSNIYHNNNFNLKYDIVDFETTNTEHKKIVSLTPFISGDLDETAESIINIQTIGLAQRLKKINCKKVVLGISGGLDSTLALLCAINAFEINGYNRDGIIGITMPGFGTTDKTLNNSLKLMDGLKITKRIVDIKKACLQHFADINHDENSLDITYENTQARERTQILMDIANQEGAIVVGTGDLSELALGWCTYNGDHMSMYSVNAGIPKTLVRHLVKYYAEKKYANTLGQYLTDIINTPISPELLPPKSDGTINQKTEERIGNYTIHDFTMYYMLKYGFTPEKILKLFKDAASKDDEWKYVPDDYIINNMKRFYSRFYKNQFKRNCVPDGIKVVDISLSPRNDWRMASDTDLNLEIFHNY